MPRIEFQISTPMLLQTIQQLLEPRLYAQCFVSPVPLLYLDRIDVGVQGPITQPSSLESDAALNVALSATIFVATAEEVQAAQGGSPVSALFPKGVPLTANVLVTLSGTKFHAKYDQIVHNEYYISLEKLVAEFVGGLANAKQVFSQWENILKQALGATSLISFDFKNMLPPQVKNLPNGRSALCADSKIVVARFEVGTLGSDGSWPDFHNGKPGDLIGEHNWGLFISGDVLAEAVNGVVRDGVSNTLGQIPTVTGNFGLLAKSGPLSYSPIESIAPKTASVTTTATIVYDASLTTFGLTTTDQGDLQFIATLIFTMTGQNAGSHAEPALDISLFYTIQNQLGGFLGGLFSVAALVYDAVGLLETIAESLTTELPNFLTFQTALPPFVVEKLLTLTATGCTGTVEPPVSSSVQNEINSLSTGVLDGPALPIGSQISPPGSGLLIFGKAVVAAAKSQPKCGVSSTPFFLVYNDNTAAVHQNPPTSQYVPAIGTFSVFNMGPHASQRYPLIVGAFFPYPDPTAQWYQDPSLLPQTPRKAGTFVVTIPEAQFRPAYMAAPYPLSLIVCTNGGARFVSMGWIPAPDIDPKTGIVLNAEVVLIFPPTPPYSGGTSSGPQHPVTSNKAPGQQ